ncbi:hypothetical protein Bhyg_06165 [Pseudolycoriella hygida]|uniref:Uncharacterized protein n=1 Tax=Pseudolycoriella hygida TaxID=35572 RepID=A0A9Q0S2K3_9DIPT|nr:hypothetical protein Bhyg_06165 [Pseudolycoriella hygida]
MGKQTYPTLNGCLGKVLCNDQLPHGIGSKRRPVKTNKMNRGIQGSRGRRRGTSQEASFGRQVAAIGRGRGRGSGASVTSVTQDVVARGRGRGREQIIAEDFLQATSANLPLVSCFSVAEYYKNLIIPESRQSS